MIEMRSEDDLVPYAPGRLGGSPVLVLAPHPDDEVFGCGGAIVQLRNAGTDVRVVIFSDGEAQGDPEVRRAEARHAAKILGLDEPEFWGLGDRSLRADDLDLADRLRTLFTEFAPGLVLLPSPAEIHPDHRAVAMLGYSVIQSASPGSALHDALQATRLAAYEVSAVLRPNLLVDVTGEWETVLSAAAAYASQLEHRPYTEVMEGMARARRLTLPQEVERAEAYHVVDPRYIRTHSLGEWAAAQGPIADLETASEVAQLDVVVRTRNRPHLLRDALASIRTQIHPAQKVIVVNDGGESVATLCSSQEGVEIDLVECDESRGRSAAAQLGLERATAPHVVFLDDDDLMYPDHLLVLAQAVARSVTAPYVDAVQGLWRVGEDGDLEPVSRHRTFGGGFDEALFGLINHIPLPCIAIPRKLALEVGGFDSELDFYEDWDLMLRLVEKTPLTHLPRVTVEYRIVEGSGGITGANPPGSPGQLAALESLWRRHGFLDDAGKVASAVMSLVAARDRASELARIRDEELLDSRGVRDGLESELRRIEAEGERMARANRELEGRVAALEAVQSEVERLGAILEQIYSSRTWKLHELLESLRGRSGPK